MRIKLKLSLFSDTAYIDILKLNLSPEELQNKEALYKKALLEYINNYHKPDMVQVDSIEIVDEADTPSLENIHKALKESCQDQEDYLRDKGVL